MLEAQRSSVLWDRVAGSQCLQSPGWGRQAERLRTAALKVFAVAASDLRLCFQSSSQVNPLNSECTRAAQRKYLSLKDTSLRHIGF